MAILKRIYNLIARRRLESEERRREAFGVEFDRRRAAVENDQTLSAFEREMVRDSAPNLSRIREYMVRHRTWAVPYWAYDK